MHDKYGNLKTSSSFTMFPLPKTFASSFLALTMMCGFRNSSVIAHSIVFEVVSLPATNVSYITMHNFL
ncbi:hypothetical protein Hanom_Chr02g00126531 [Helianthus anomalus]